MIIIRNIRCFINSIFVYLEQQESIKPIIFLRFSLSLFAIVKIAVLYNYLNDVYGQYGYIQWAISKAGLYDFLPHFGDIAILLDKHFDINATQTIYLMFWVYITFLLMLFVGLFSRLSSIVCFYLHLMWIDTGAGFMYGVDVFTQIAFFYLMFMPTGRNLSLDVFFKLVNMKLVSSSAGLVRKLLRFQLMIVYTSSGIEKGLGIQWWNGEAMWRSLMLPSFQQFDMSWLSHFPILMSFSGWCIVIIETLYPIMMLLPKCRILWLFLVTLMHLFIGVFLGMWLFGFIMIILSFATFGHEVLEEIREISWSGFFTLQNEAKL